MTKANASFGLGEALSGFVTADLYQGRSGKPQFVVIMLLDIYNALFWKRDVTLSTKESYEVLDELKRFA